MIEALRILVEVHSEYYLSAEQNSVRASASESDDESTMQSVVSEYVKNILGDDTERLT